MKNHRYDDKAMCLWNHLSGSAQRYFALIFLLLLSSMNSAQATLEPGQNESKQSQLPRGELHYNEMQLHAEQWDLARHGEKILHLPEVRALVNAWAVSEQQLIELRYPGGEEGELWVQELMDWLISLGIPSQYIVVVPGSGEADVIKFQIIKAGDSYR